MPKVIVLGGCGAVGSVAVQALARHALFDRVVIADARRDAASRLAADIGSDKVSVAAFDARSAGSVKEAIRGADVVVNCVGPFYATVKTILSAVLQSGVNYVDVCDDVDVTLDLLSMDGEARKAGVTAVIGMGSSPGVTNLLAKLAAETLLDETEAVDIYHAHGGEPVEGEGVIGHRFHCMTIDIPMYLDGELRHVKFFGEDGIALRETFDFPVLGKVEVFPYPHPEQVTIPRTIKLRRVTNRGSVLPAAYHHLTLELCRLGLGSLEAIQVKGQSVIPAEFAVAYILRERERILRETIFGEQRGCVSILVKGTRHGKPREYRFHFASRSQALGEGTGLPVAIAAILMGRGQIPARGILPPEACIDPGTFIATLPEVMDLDEKKEGGRRFGGVIAESVDENGNVTKLDLF